MVDVAVAEQPQDPHDLLVESLHGPQKRSLPVQRLSGIGAEGRGDAQYIILNKGVGRGIPGGVSTGFKGGADAAGGEGGGIRFAVDQVGAGELVDDPAAAHGTDEAVVLLRGDTVERLEPVGEVGGSVFQSPVLHGVGHHIGHFRIQSLVLFDGGIQCLVGDGGQPLPHHVVVKYLGTKDLGEIHRDLLSVKLSIFNAKSRK